MTERGMCTDQHWRDHWALAGLPDRKGQTRCESGTQSHGTHAVSRVYRTESTCQCATQL